MRLVTDRLELREFEWRDWQAMLAYQSDQRYLRYYPWTDRDAARVQQMIGQFVERQAEDPRVVFQLAITLKSSSPDPRFIGSCGVRVNDAEQREGNIGYELDPAYWGQGYAIEAARAVLGFGFEHLDLHRIWAQCVAENQASARILEKLGMRREAHFREGGYFKDRWWDSFVYAMLEHEWQSRGRGHSAMLGVTPDILDRLRSATRSESPGGVAT